LSSLAMGAEGARAEGVCCPSLTMEGLKMTIVPRGHGRSSSTRGRMRQAASSGYLNATDLADYLAARGMPFREAHGCVGRAVSYALGKGRELEGLSIEELRSFSQLIADDIFEQLSLEEVIRRRNSQRRLKQCQKQHRHPLPRPCRASS